MSEEIRLRWDKTKGWIVDERPVIPFTLKNIVKPKFYTIEDTSENMEAREKDDE